MNICMRGAVLYQTGKPLKVGKNLEIPKLKAGQVLVKVAFAGLCRSQIMEIKGNRGNDPFLPHLLGHEGTGIVFEVGPQVTKVHPGQRVVLGWIKGSGAEVPKTTYSAAGVRINSGAVTTFSDYSVVSENRCTVLPDGVPMDVGVLFGCAVLTGAGIITNEIKPAPGTSLAIFGLGGIGTSALIACKLFDLKQLIVVEPSKSKRQLALELGATKVIDSTKTDPVRKIYNLTSDSGVDYSVECAGLSQTIEQSFNSVRKNGGRCIFASHPPNGDKISLEPHALISGKQISGSWGGMSKPDRDIPLFAGLYREGKLPIQKLISKRYPLEEINLAIEDLDRGLVGRPLIEINPSLN